jgi:hypothetical protein
LSLKEKEKEEEGSIEKEEKEKEEKEKEGNNELLIPINEKYEDINNELLNTRNEKELVKIHSSSSLSSTSLFSLSKDSFINKNIISMFFPFPRSPLFYSCSFLFIFIIIIIIII